MSASKKFENVLNFCLDNPTLKYRILNEKVNVDSRMLCLDNSALIYRFFNGKLNEQLTVYDTSLAFRLSIKCWVPLQIHFLIYIKEILRGVKVTNPKTVSEF